MRDFRTWLGQADRQNKRSEQRQATAREACACALAIVAGVRQGELDLETAAVTLGVIRDEISDDDTSEPADIVRNAFNMLCDARG